MEKFSMSDVKYYKISDINPAQYNPRIISDAAFEGLKESIKKFGIVGNFVVNTKNNVLVSGHQRLKACESLGIKKVPVIEVDLSEAEEKALNIALNSQAISGDYTDGLQDLLEEIKLEFPEYQDIKLDMLEIDTSWDSDIEALDKISENLDGIEGKIKITCHQDDKDEVLIYLKEKLMETSFEGVHIE